MAERRTVLAVDDEPDNLLLMRLHLHTANYRVLEASSGAEAMAVLDRERPDAVLLDLRMPGVSGWDVIAWLRSEGRMASTPVIAISAHAGPETVERAIGEGCRGYISKPFTRAELLDTIAACLLPES